MTKITVYYVHNLNKKQPEQLDVFIPLTPVLNPGQLQVQNQSTKNKLQFNYYLHLKQS